MTEKVDVFTGKLIGLADFETVGCTMGVVYGFVDITCLWIKVLILSSTNEYTHLCDAIISSVNPSEGNICPDSFVLTRLLAAVAQPYLGFQIGELSLNEKAEVLFVDQAFATAVVLATLYSITSTSK
ncbi:CAAX amino terminal protease family protein [Artemisia annua]|uniref:CAAX amino terminal protease family protein n=1 Tax=Artemisia annua TaxID=35608 RepID=A0A2U1MF17_ARTAN|nr:CAAX amino terminal protease family protein [Artemisia annua]